MAQHNDLGIEGERMAQQYLEQQGYQILAKNWIYKKAEIDLIAQLGSQLIFVEVKTRTGTGFGLPEDFVDKAKQKQMEIAANAYIEQVAHEHEIRFDIIAILFNPHQQAHLNHIEDAFWPY